MRTMGTVKWFDRATGAGCAVSDSGTQAAFTSATLEPFGLYAIEAGVPLVYDLKLEGGRLVVGAIHEIAGKGPNPGAATRNQPSPVTHAPEPGRVKARVRCFDRDKGFGFIASKDVDGDVLLHRSVLHPIGVDSVFEGAVIDCDVVQKIGGLHVRRVHAVLASDEPVVPPASSYVTGGSIVLGRGPHEDLMGVKVRKLKWLSPPKGFGFFDVRADDGPWVDAVCKWFSRPKGYGFLRLAAGSADIFIHMDTLRRCGVRGLRKGQRVRVRVSEHGNGPLAAEIELDGD